VVFTVLVDSYTVAVRMNERDEIETDDRDDVRYDEEQSDSVEEGWVDVTHGAPQRLIDIAGIMLGLIWLGGLYFQGLSQDGSTRQLDCSGPDVNVTVMTDCNIDGVDLVAGQVLCADTLGTIYGIRAATKIDDPWPEGPFDYDAYSLAKVLPEDGCTTIDKVIMYDGTGNMSQAALVRRGGCTFQEKALNLKESGIELMIEYDGIHDECVRMDLRNDSMTDIDMLGISVASSGAFRVLLPNAPKENDSMIYESSAVLEDQSGNGPVLVAISKPVTHGHFLHGHVAAIALGGLALLIIFLGSLWVSTVERDSWQIPEHEMQRLYKGRLDNHVITLRAAWTFLFVASAALLLMLVLSSKIFYSLFALLFAVLCWDSMILVMSRWASASLTDRGASLQTLRIADIAVVVTSTVIVGAWIILRHAPLWWVLQDYLALWLCVASFGLLQIPSLKIGAILLGSALVYDVWWVYLQPMVTGSASAMVSIAKHHALPLFLAFPEVGSVGTAPAYAILGLGDVLLPGLLIIFAYRWGLRKCKTSNQKFGINSCRYFWPLCGAYIAGLVLTYIALSLNIGGQHGQPALLYLVPTTLGSCVLLAILYGEFDEMWQGFSAQPLASADAQQNITETLL
jgi:signal peptide peptidase-like protein 2B